MTDSSPKREFLVNFVSGAISGTVSSIAFQPLDLLKTKLQLHVPAATVAGYGGSTTQTAAHIVRAETLWGLWRGTVPAIVRCVPGIGLYFGCISTLKTLYGKPDQELKMHETLAMGLVSRALVSMCVMPQSVLKTRYECGSFGYSTLGGSTRKIVITEGLLGFYRGAVASVMRDASFSGLYLTFYMKSKQATRSHLDLQELKPVHNICCGSFAALAAATLTQPADVIRTHQQVRRTTSKGLLTVIKAVVKEKGPLGLFTGLGLRLVRRGCMATFTWATYEEIVKVVRNIAS